MARSAIPPEEVKVLDTNASYLGVRTINLMENAGAAVAKYVLSISKPASKLAVICGKGNNGGDGFVAARHLAKQVQTDLFLIEPEQDIASDIARMNLESARESLRPLPHLDTRKYDIIVDAMLGIGLQGSPRIPYPRYIKLLNDSRKTIVSIDVPSGWPSDLRIRSDVTVTFHAPKVGMNKENSGKIVVVDIGIPPDAETYCGPGDFALLPRRRKDSHKGDSGRVLVIGGGPYTGAPAFTGMAAMRSGVDLTYIATPETSAIPVAIYSPSYIVRALEGEILREDHVKELLQFSKGMDVVAIGPGLGNAPETISAIQSIVRSVDKPLVVDADAIGACGAKPQILKKKAGVLTPHAGEFKKLTGKTLPQDDLDKRKAVVREAASRLKMTILLKGPVDIISDGSYIKLNRIHNDAMTVGGTGDVLTGIVAGLIAQKATPFGAARIGAFTAGLAGDLAFEEKSYGLLATDVIEKIPFVLRRYL
ncbi:MAG: NAD(P)H-hydrate dehydratase [Thermoplasmatota archaeon]|nr:NAD(P)H-hydrate dehydratase [Candidatus Thermoplasmatota archaeon]MBU1914329.1 NAD(P)H-hydrate dehydratase [Candidatus Thermoplasmatota archaeon]